MHHILLGLEFKIQAWVLSVERENSYPSGIEKCLLIFTGQKYLTQCIPSYQYNVVCNSACFFKIYLYPRTFFHYFLKREEQREREKHWCERETSTLCLPRVPVPEIICIPTRDWTYNLGMCLDQESNPQPYSYRMMANQLNYTGQAFSMLFDYIIYLMIAQFRDKNLHIKKANNYIGITFQTLLL